MGGKGGQISGGRRRFDGECKHTCNIQKVYHSIIYLKPI